MVNPLRAPNQKTAPNETAWRRWMYRGQRPNWLARILNNAWATVVSLGVASEQYVTLQVIGRKSGRVIAFPLVMAKVNGERYLVSMLGENVQWVRNVRAADGKAVLSCRGREDVQLVEVPVNQRAAILKAYLQIATGARPHVPVDKDAPPAEFENIAPQIPIFWVTNQ